MKALLFGLFLLALTSAHAEVVRRDGHTHAGEECSLTIENWDGNSTTRDWETEGLVVRSSWQKAEHPSLVAKRSFTPGALYGRDLQTRDQIAVNFDDGEMSPNLIRSYSFQSAVDGLFQAFCRFR
ncbi:MAG TPA: hypothetical protein PL182_10775 [Pseudobdellovibrionaceae bacterium]|nr:hypothetical protein [Pseudobdellovibrionaceae bacterium]